VALPTDFFASKAVSRTQVFGFVDSLVSRTCGLDYFDHTSVQLGKGVGMRGVRFVGVSESFSALTTPLLRTVAEAGAEHANLRRTCDLLKPKLITGQIDVEGMDVGVGGEGI
jgi:hypothetical protein